MTPPKPATPRRPAFLPCWLLTLAFAWGCMEPGPETHYIALKLGLLEDTLYAYQRINIALIPSLETDDTLDVLWDGPIPDSGLPARIRTNRYQGGKAIVVIAAFDADKLRLRRYIGFGGDSAAYLEPDRDTVLPILLSRLPEDTLTLENWADFPESLVTCMDERDGELQHYIDTVPKDIGRPAEYKTYVYCVDLSRNLSWDTIDSLQVIVLSADRPRMPVITLAGRDTLDLPVGSGFQPAATCRDAKGRELPVTTIGQVEGNRIGKHTLEFRCRDADRRETVRRQLVWITDTLDSEPPVVTLRGPDSLDHRLGEPYVDGGAACMDLRDGPLPVMGGGDVDVHTPGVYGWYYKCVDKTGNNSQPYRIVRVVDFETAPGIADAITDTTAKTRPANSGSTPVLTFGKMKRHPDPWVTLLAFDLKGVRRDSLQSAKGVFRTYISGPYLPGLDSVKVVFVVHRILSPWVEGTGNWYFNRGYYRNDGQVFLRNHPFREEIRARSVDGIEPNGFTKEQVDIVRLANLREAGTDTVVLAYAAANFSDGHPGSVPVREHLVPVEIDLTRYVKEAEEGEDHGLIITVEGMPDNLWINWVTRELGDGSMGPYLKLFY